MPVQEMWVRSLGQEDPLGKGMATLSCILAWKLFFEGEFDFWKWYNVFRVNIWSTQNPVPRLVVGEAFLLLFTLSLKSLEEKQFQKCPGKWPHFPCVPI